MAIRCVAASVSWDSEEEYWARNRRVLAHARQFQLARFRDLKKERKLRLCAKSLLQGL
jgi:hypothetical protein